MGFEYVTRQAIREGVTVELELNQLLVLGRHPALVVEHLGQSNREFWADALAQAGTAQAAARAASGRALTPEEVAVGREKNRDTVARYSVRGLIDWYHAGPDGRPDPTRPATNEDIRAVVFALPPEVFDDVLRFVTNAENFRQRSIEGDPKAIAGK